MNVRNECATNVRGKSKYALAQPIVSKVDQFIPYRCLVVVSLYCVYWATVRVDTHRCE